MGADSPVVRAVEPVGPEAGAGNLSNNESVELEIVETESGNVDERGVKTYEVKPPCSMSSVVSSGWVRIAVLGYILLKSLK